jgi:Winged helix DNA-binding domain
MLLRRRRVPVLDAVERLVALQAQVPRDPYVALWSRLDRFRPEKLSQALDDRRAVRMTLLRGTLHLVTVRDALALRPLIQPIVERILYGQILRRKEVESTDLDELLSFLRTLLEERPRTRAELARAIEKRWPDKDPNSLGFAMYLLPTLQATPRGLWGRTGPSAFTTLEHWLGRSPEPDRGPDHLVLRYLAAFGPATAADVQTWSGLTRLREALERLRPGLRTFRDERGRELFDVQDGSLPDPETPAPVRFLPEYDNVVLGHRDRTRIVSPAVPLWTELGWGAVLVDGFLQARWKLEGGKEAATVRIQPLRRLRRAEREEITEEGERLAAFLGPDADERSVRVEPAGKIASGS